VAYDEELNREVALKELRRRYAEDAKSMSQFLFEAEVTAGLEHPGVVPIYGVGRHPDGRAYFTMRLIRGQSLRDAIRALHRDGGHGALASGLRRLLDRMVDVCYTVAYAHRRGILHRDVTPDNIMLGVHGETLVIDWGLAKPLGRPAPSDEADSTLAGRWPISARDRAGTGVGVPIGTIWFMSPEQAEGRPDRLGPATDVYALGATLYMALTGRAPFVGSDREEVRQLVQRGDFPPPRRVRRTIAPTLEAICLKAMAADPGDRHASALDLGDEIARWLAGRPAGGLPKPPSVGRASPQESNAKQDEVLMPAH